jgi:hypothetical protein
MRRRARCRCRVRDVGGRVLGLRGVKEHCTGYRDLRFYRGDEVLWYSGPLG